HQRIDVAVGKHDETGAQRRNDFVLQAIGKIGGVKQAHGNAAQGMPFLRLLESLAGQGRAGHPGVENRVTVVLEPLLEQADVRRAADAVGSLQHDQLALELAEIYIREPLAKELKSTHLLILVFLVPASASDTRRRTSACCSSMERVASMAT